MIGLVVVSHSRALAEAAVGLASEMVEAGRRPAIEVAAGLDEHTFGTDAAAVAEAIDRADSGDGVVVLLDLGSAVLSAEMALEFVDPDLAGRVRLSSAPLVEGLVAATVAAAAGADLDTVAREAAGGLAAKQAHLEEAAPGEPAPGEKVAAEGETSAGAAAEPERTVVLEVTAEHGLHARPAARFVQTVAAFPATVRVRNLDTGRGPVDARSLTSLATLDARQGHRIEVTADGDGAEEVLRALEELAGTQFGDAPGSEPQPGTAGAARPGAAARAGDTAGAGDTPAASGTPAVPPARGSGLDGAVGVVRRPDAPVDLSSYRAGAPAEERERLEHALARAREELVALEEQTLRGVGAAEAGIFAAHRAMLDDPDLAAAALAALDAGRSAPEAWQERVTELRGRFEALEDAYQRERAQDVVSVGNRVLRLLAGAEGVGEDDARAEDQPAVLVVDELDPARAATLDPAAVAGVITLRGGATGHGVLIARARGVPVLPGAGSLADVAEGTLVAFDARSGRVVVDPDAATLREFEQLLADRARRRAAAEEHAGEPATTTDGHTVQVKANVGSVGDAAQAVALGADGSGLVRTEVLFGGHRAAPSVPEQVEVLTRVAEALQGRPMTVRTWDIGGDKPLPFLTQEPEDNPFLGVRGIRSFRRDATLLVDQLEAICRVARRHRVRVMFPMVTAVEEVEWALARLDEAAGRLADGRPDGLEVGIMVEVPAAALRAEAMSTLLDFVSIGSNDLAQYTLAAERGNPGVRDLADQADPAVLRLIALICAEVAEGVEVCVCGDAASDPELACLLVGLGVTELSAAASAVPMVKAALRERSLTDLRDLGERALRCDSAAEVRDLLGG